MAGDWIQVRLGDVSINHDAVRVPVREADRIPGPYPYYGASGVVDHVNGYLFDGEYLLVAEDGENLRTRQTPIAFIAKGQFWVNNHAHILQGNSRALTRYLHYAVTAGNIDPFLTGAVMPKLTQSNLHQIPILLPTLHDQAQIVEVLQALDDKIELNRRMAETLEAMARAVFKSWFVDFDPVRAKAEGRLTGLLDDLAALFPDSFDGDGLPAGWRRGSLRDLARLNPESWTGDTVPEIVDYVDLANTKWGTIETVQKLRRSEAPSRAQRVLRPGDTIVGVVRPGNGSFAYIRREGLTGSTGFAALRPVSPRQSCIIYLAVTARENIEALASLADGAAYPAVRSDDVIDTPVVVPEAAVIDAFDTAISPVFAAIYDRAEQSRTLTSLRDTLLPKLISGELRIANVEQRIAAA